MGGDDLNSLVSYSSTSSTLQKGMMSFAHNAYAATNLDRGIAAVKDRSNLVASSAAQAATSAVTSTTAAVANTAAVVTNLGHKTANIGAETGKKIARFGKALWRTTP